MEKSNSDYNKRVRELRRNVRSTLKMTPGGGGYTVVSKTNSSTLLPSATGSNECTKRRKIKETDVEGFTETDVKGITETDVEGFTETDVDRPSDNLPIVDQASNAQPPVDHPSAQRHSSQTITSELSYYLSLTRERDGVVPVGQKMLCLANYVEKTGTVDVTDYKVVIKINGSMYCSCGKAQELMLGDCRPVATWASIELCQHMNVLRRCTSLPALDNWFDTEHTYSSHSDLVSTSSVHAVNEWTAIVYDSRTNRFGCVYIHAGSIRCRCSSHRGTCVFISAFKVAMKDDESLGPLQANLLSRETITISERTSVSWKPIVIATSRLNIPTSSTAMKLQCSQCDGNMFREMQTEDVRCFDVFGTITVRVTSGVCVSCKASSRCDGGDEGILNMGDYLVTHRLLRDYLKLFTSDGLPLHSFHKKLYWSYLEHGFAAGTCLSYHLLRMAWGAFSKLLILNNFSCPKCKVNPPVIVCDGLTLSYRKRHRYTTDNPSSTSTSPLHGCKYSDLLILRDTSFRNQLLRVMSDDNIQQDDISQLLSDARTKAVFMVDILSQFLTWQDVPKYWSHLLKDIAKSSPMNGFAQTSADNFLKIYDIISGSSSKLYDCDLKTIAQICPPVFYFVKSSTATDRRLLLPIMSEILKVLQYVEASPGHLFAESLGIEDTAGMFPELPVIRERGAYAMDSSQATGSCRKLAKGHKNLLPGIFLLHCEHGVCYGFHVMDSHESPNVPFTIIQTRFQQAPKVIIYDNACHLHSYALNRNPAYFRGTKFLVDRFHWNNHTACSSGYCVDGYPQLRSLNTQLAEQRNSTLVRLKASLSYQHQDNFFHSMKVFLSFRNTLKVLMIRNPENDAENTLAQLLGLFK